MNLKIIYSVFISFCILNTVNGANILGLFHFPSKSHHILGKALFKELAARGHNVTMISPFPFKEKIANYTDIELKGFMEFKAEFMDPGLIQTSYTMLLKNGFRMLPALGKLVLGQDSMQEFLKSNSTFDLVILFCPMCEGFLGLSHHFDAPVILFSPIGTTMFLNTIAGNINPYSYVPSFLTPYTEDMTFKERVINTLVGLGMEVLHRTLMLPQQRSISEEYFPDAPPLEELFDKVALSLVNFSTESPRPYTPNLIQIGGFHIENTEPLPKDLKQYLDDSKQGVIYLSFGSNIDMSKLPEDKINIIIKCLSKIKQNVIWKYDGDNLQGKPKNVRIEKWLPQKGILEHSNVQAFITHGGKGSVVESMKAGVPMLAIPFFGDQPQNVADAATQKYAIHLEFKNMTEENFSHALNEILNNPVYRENIKKRSSLLNEQPMKPMDTAVYWIDHVIKYKGADHLKPLSTKLNVFQQLLLDVITVIAIALTILGLLVYYTCKGVYKLLCRRKKNTDKLKTS